MMSSNLNPPVGTEFDPPSLHAWQVESTCKHKYVQAYQNKHEEHLSISSETPRRFLFHNHQPNSNAKYVEASEKKHKNTLISEAIAKH